MNATSTNVLNNGELIMKRISKILSFAFVVAAGTASSNKAHADVGIPDLLVFLCGKDVDTGLALWKDAAEKCAVVDGQKSICSITSGSPWACATQNGPTKVDHPDTAEGKCLGGNPAEVKMEGEVKTGLGWNVKVNATGKVGYSARILDDEVCKQVPITPAPTAAGGKFVNRVGTLVYLAQLELTGDITLTPKVGLGLTFSNKLDCPANVVSRPVHTEETVVECKAPPAAGTGQPGGPICDMGGACNDCTACATGSMCPGADPTCVCEACPTSCHLECQ
jgi:hypothetical protein